MPTLSLLAACLLAPWPEGAPRTRDDEPALFSLVEADKGWVQPLAPAGRFLVVTSEWTSIADVGEGWVRHLDQTGAMLEGCRVVSRGRALECGLDLTLGPMVRFDAEGHTTDTRFQPRWLR